MVIRRVSAKAFRKMAAARRAAGPGAGDRQRSAAVRAIIRDVRRRGDRALVEYAARFDGVELSPDDVRLRPEEISAGASACPAEVREALAAARANIEAFHRRQWSGSWWEEAGGIWRGQLIRPLDSVGIYVPGGTAAYPSTVLMTAVPARVAGVGRIVICTPPAAAAQAAGAPGTVVKAGVPAPVLAAAEACGITEIHRVGGAQAVAAMAYGTATIARVDKIVGPGNAFVAEAKRQVAGDVGIDAVAGPSEVLIIADETADPALLAADLLAQAEHDALAVPILVATSKRVLEQTAAELEARLAQLSRKSIAAKALAGQGALVLATDLDEAVELASAFAPEHLELQVDDPFAILPAVRGAGSVFLGPLTAEAFGDYAAGVNHVLPTSGTARFVSSLGVADFTVRSQALAMAPAGVAALARPSTILARAEGLEAHALAVEARRSGSAESEAVGGRAAPAPAELERSLAAGARAVFAAWGYREVGVPLFIPLDELEPGLGSNGLRSRLFKFVDSAGRVTVVRPDWTLPIARQAVPLLRANAGPNPGPTPAPTAGPLRLSYAGDVYRRAGRASTLAQAASGDWEAARVPQAGVELLGLGTTWSDAELVAVAVEILERSGLDDFTLCIGHAGLAEAVLSGLSAAAGADPDDVRSMRAALIDRDLVAWDGLSRRPGLDQARAGAARAVIAHRSPGDGLAAAARAASVFGPAALGPLDELGDLAAILASAGSGGHVVFDLGLVRDLDYYTGVVFEAYAAGCGRPVLTGGRYDGLLAAFGVDCPAVGLAVEVDALGEALAVQGPPATATGTPTATGAPGIGAAPLRPVEVTPGSEAGAFRLAAALRRLGLRAELRPAAGPGIAGAAGVASAETATAAGGDRR